MYLIKQYIYKVNMQRYIIIEYFIYELFKIFFYVVLYICYLLVAVLGSI